MSLQVKRPLSSPISIECFDGAVTAELKKRQARTVSVGRGRAICPSYVRLQPGAGALFLNDIEVLASCSHPGVADILRAKAHAPRIANMAIPAAIVGPFAAIAAFAISPLALLVGLLLIGAAGWMAEFGARLWLEELLSAIEQRAQGESGS